MVEYLGVFIKGFLLMGSLIFAVGPQNAMLIRHGLRKDRPFLIAAIFSLCDFLMIILGVFGVGQIIAQIYWLRIIITYGGALFLLYFSFKSIRSAWRGGQNIALDKLTPQGKLISTAFAISILNPGVIIDTVVIVGSVSSKYALAHAAAFGLGAQTFSVLFFFTLAGFTKYFANTLNKPTVWRIVDLGVGLITLWIGIHLLLYTF